MKYLLVVLLVASIASMEFFHELSGHDPLAVAACMGPAGQADAVRDVLLAHLKSH